MCINIVNFVTLLSEWPSWNTQRLEGFLTDLEGRGHSQKALFAISRSCEVSNAKIYSRFDKSSVSTGSLPRRLYGILAPGHHIADVCSIPLQSQVIINTGQHSVFSEVRFHLLSQRQICARFAQKAVQRHLEIGLRCGASTSVLRRRRL